MRNYHDFVNRQRRQFGPSFVEPVGAEHFGPFLHTGQRVRVRFAYGEELTGTIGVTTGFQPAFLLMRTSRSLGSPYTLGEGDRIVAVQHGRHYVAR